MSDGFSRVQVRKLVDKTALYGITNGTAAANKAMVTDGSVNIAGMGSINKVTLTAPATGATLTLADGKTLTCNNSLTLAGTDATTMTFPSASGTVVTTASVGGSAGAIATGSYSQASNTTLANVTGLVSPTLVAGATYVFYGYLATTNNATGGIKLLWAANGGLTATSFLQDTWTYNTTTVSAEGNITALASNPVNAAVAATAVEFSGTIVVNAGGTMQLQAAQNTSNGTALTIANNSYVIWTRIA